MSVKQRYVIRSLILRRSRLFAPRTARVRGRERPGSGSYALDCVSFISAILCSYLLRSKYVARCNCRLLACVAWRFKLFFEREWSGEAAKASGEAAKASGEAARFLSCLSPRLLATLGFVIAVSPLKNRQATEATGYQFIFGPFYCFQPGFLPIDNYDCAK